VNKRTKEFIIDNVSRAAQIVFAVLIISPFVSGFNPFTVTSGIIIYSLLMFFGIGLSKSIKEEE
jgi:hypothetical protein